MISGDRYDAYVARVIVLVTDHELAYCNLERLLSVTYKISIQFC